MKKAELQEVTDEALGRRIQEEIAPVKTTLDLNCFVKFSKDRAPRKDKWVVVSKNGFFQFSTAASQKIEASRVELYINKVGTIIAIKPVTVGGIPLTATRGRSLRFYCREALKYLKERGIEPSVHYMLEWDSELGVWVGRQQ